MNKYFQPRYWKRGFNRLLTIVGTKWSEKTFQGANGERILYVLKRTSIKCDTLLVCFPGCSDIPKYNYVGSLRPIHCHKLFVKDDASSDKKGNYMIGGGNALTIRMIEECAKKIGCGKFIFVGSSKGGYSALNFSLQIPNSYVCIAAPQYRLGSYLNSGFIPSLESIIGKISDDGIKQLDIRLKNMICNTEILPLRVYLHVSKNEHTWKDHCEEMVADLQQRGVPIEFDWGTYTQHSDLIYHYPKYLQETVTKLISKNNTI